MSRATDLAKAHWNYIEALLKEHGVEGGEIDRIGFHYRSALVHGHGHGVEDERKGWTTEGFIKDEA